MCIVVVSCGQKRACVLNETLLRTDCKADNVRTFYVVFDFVSKTPQSAIGILRRKVWIQLRHLKQKVVEESRLCWCRRRSKTWLMQIADLLYREHLKTLAHVQQKIN